MTGIAGWFFAYLFFMAVELFFRSLISLWFCAGALGAWIGLLWGGRQRSSFLCFFLCLFFHCGSSERPQGGEGEAAVG
jgi:hypothetical protein